MSANHQVSTSTGKVLPFNPSELALEKLVDKALTEPGFVSKAFTTFYGYSLNNRLSALWQCMVRGIEPGPLASYRAWQALDRQVQTLNRRLLVWHRQDQASQRLATIPGVGVISATAGYVIFRRGDLP